MHEACLSLAELLGRLAPVCGRHGTGVPGLTIVRCEAPTEPWPCFYEPALLLVAQGAKEVQAGRRSLRYDAGHFLVASLDVPVQAAVVEGDPARPFLALSLRLDLEALADLVGDLPHPAQALDTEEALCLAPPDAPLLEAATRLAALAEQADDLQALGPLRTREVLYYLLKGPMGPRLRHLMRRDGPTQSIARATAFLQTHFARAVPIEQLARTAGMSASTLHHHFKRLTTLTPLQYQKHLRLQEARRLLLQGADAAEAGHQVGYQSPSQFGRDYRRLFGRTPRQDVPRSER